MTFGLALVFAADPALAYSTGITGRTTLGCSCHAALADATTTVTFGAPAVVGPGEVVAVTLTVSSTNAARVAAGLNVYAASGALGAGSDTILSGVEITHAAPQAFSAGAVTFDFTWTAPIAAGIYTLEAAGNAVNLSGTNSGDGWNFASDLQIEVDPGLDADGDGAGVTIDCDDNDPLRSPLEDEVCDGIDNDCDDEIDVDPVDGTLYYPDADLDQYGEDGAAVNACSAPFGHVDTDGDCNDANGAVNPDADEICDVNDVDENCDGLVDDITAVDATAWYPDQDGDTYGGFGLPTVQCDQPPGTTDQPGDCNDLDPQYNPGAVEDCSDPNDYNCDGATGFVDTDGDGWAACVECDDANAMEYPGAPEACDNEDDDCDGYVDEDPDMAPFWYLDEDEDGFGGDTVVEACDAPPGYVAAAGDCEDDDPDVYPYAAEVWYDDVDQNCDGNDDDQDGDEVDAPDDCVDTDPDIFPGAEDEPYDGVDADCAGDDDFDVDGDGHAAGPPAGTGDDCNDFDAAVHPGAEDAPCDGIDRDCDPGPDDDPTCGTPTTPTAGTGGTGSKGGGCGCAGAGPGSGALLVLVLAVLTRRR